MSATDLKNLLHEQIDRLQQEEDLRDLLLTVSEFVSHRGVDSPESPALMKQLTGALESATTGHFTPHHDVIKEAKQWITK